jgi:small subunit ribosomal protein S8
MNSFNNVVAEINKGILGVKSNVFVFSSIFVVSLLDLLLKYGFIRNFVVSTNGDKINVFLKYIERKGVFTKLVVVSKPGRRVYVSKEELQLGYGFGGTYVISCSKGLFLYQYGQRVECGGEVVLKILS